MKVIYNTSYIFNNIHEKTTQLWLAESSAVIYCINYLISILLVNHMHSFKSIPHNSMPRTIPRPESENPYHPNTQKI